ncbi:RNA-binding protein [Allohahella marinimesophila]
MKLLVRNLDRATTEAALRELFEPFGAIQSCRLVLDADTGLSKGFGFVEMPKVGDAKAAIQRLNGFTVDGRAIRVKKAEAPTAEPDVKDV